MKNSVEVKREVVVTAPDRVGILSEICEQIAGAHVNIQAICAYEVDKMAHLRLITDDNEKAIQVLRGAGFEATEKTVVYSMVAPHVLHPDVAELAGGYDVENNYWCASAHNGEHAVLVFSPRDNLKGAAIR
jgi:hypothetical protein